MLKELGTWRPGEKNSAESQKNLENYLSLIFHAKRVPWGREGEGKRWCFMT